MEKIKTRLKKYFSESSKIKIISDFIFYIFIMLMIIPGTRKEVSSLIIRATMRKPSVISEAKTVSLNPNDYEFYIEGLNAEVHNLSEFKGKPILLNYWATWCPPCRAEMPSIQKLYNDYQNKMAIILVTNEERSIVENYLSENNYDLPVYFQRSQMSNAISASAYPTTFLISPNGKILVKKTGAANWNSEDFREQIDHLINASN
jgi:thiol-disulfide isomerase/thioredoxin